MATRVAIAIRQQNALSEIRGVLEKYDTEAGERLRKAADGDAIPSSYKQPELFDAYLAECVASLSHIIDELKTPRKRGRPKKSA
jgi:hypothetical protein